MFLNNLNPRTYHRNDKRVFRYYGTNPPLLSSHSRARLSGQIDRNDSEQTSYVDDLVRRAVFSSDIKPSQNGCGYPAAERPWNRRLSITKAPKHGAIPCQRENTWIPKFRYALDQVSSSQYQTKTALICKFSCDVQDLLHEFLRSSFSNESVWVYKMRLFSSMSPASSYQRILQLHNRQCELQRDFR
jgi:hypothetical protein